MDKILLEKINHADIVSFDIFDTLITHIVDRPEAIFELIEHKYMINDFVNIRIKSQSEIGLILQKEKNYPHANLKDIYDYICKNKGIKNVKELLDYELYLEKHLLYQNPEIFEVYQYAKKLNKKIIIISDMYIELTDIKKILKNCGYERISTIYLSSEIHKAKFDGTIYDYVIEKENCLPAKILHIGDNYEHDYINTTNKGFMAYHYVGTKLDEKSVVNDIVGSLDKGIRRLLKLRKQGFWYNTGMISGLLYLKLYDELISKKYSEINFLSRDGYNLYQLFSKFNKEVKSNYIYTSRRALLLPSIKALNDNDLDNLPPFTFGQTIQEILEYISLDNIFDINDLVKVGFKNFQDKILNLDDFKKMHNLYLLKKNEVLKAFEKERKCAIKYYNKFNFDSKENLFFDCGWNGSSQYLLENFLNSFLKNFKSSFYYTGIFETEKSKKQLNNRNYKTLLFDINYNQDYVNRIKNSIIILELFFGALHNSVLKYDENGPVLEELENDFNYKKEILAGICDYFEFSKNIFKEFNLKISIDNIMKPLLRLIENPTLEEAKTIGNLKNLDGFANQKDEVKYLAYITDEQIAKNPNIEVYWYQGLLKRDDVSLEIKNKIKKRLGIVESIENDNKVILKKNSYLSRLKSSIKRNGYRTTLYLLKEKFNKMDLYKSWQNKSEIEIGSITENFNYNPLISIIVPVYNAISNQLWDCVNSVLNQTYKNWELILVDDCSTLLETKETLNEIKDLDQRITILYHQKNGHISKTTNDGIKVAKGEFIALLDNDDVLSINALYENVKLLNTNKNLDFIYSDEDKLTEDGQLRRYPFFKPDWSPDTFMSLMYTCHFSIFRKTIVDKIGGFTVGLDGAQDYGFVLRFTRETNRIAHIQKILYRNKPNMTIEEKRKRIRDVPSNYNIGKVKNLEAMKSFKKKSVFNAIIHFFSILCLAPCLTLPFESMTLQSIIISIMALILNIVNIYCIMFQRYNYIRINQIINRMENYNNYKKDKAIILEPVKSETKNEALINTDDIKRIQEYREYLLKVKDSLQFIKNADNLEKEDSLKLSLKK